MEEMTTVGLDITKQDFQVRGIASDRRVIVRRSLRRSEVLRFLSKLSRCVVGLEASGDAHHWAREIGVFGHDVRLIPPNYVKPYVKRGKTDAIDAEAICEAVSRPTKRFVPVKTTACQASQMALRSCDLLVRQRTQTSTPSDILLNWESSQQKGVAKADTLAAIVLDDTDERLPMSARKALSVLVDQLRSLTDRIQQLEPDIVTDVRASQTGRRLTQSGASGRLPPPRSRRSRPIQPPSLREGISRPGSA